MDSIPEDSMDKLSVYDNVEANKLSTNYFAPIVPIDLDVKLKQLSTFNKDPDITHKNFDVANINHLSF